MNSSQAEFLFTRVVRTTSSERYLVHHQSSTTNDLAAIDIHFGENHVAVTLMLLHEEFQSEDVVQRLINEIDTRLLPMASLNDGDLSVTVVKGQLLGHFVNEKD